jgi:hypothetical protein
MAARPGTAVLETPTVIVRDQYRSAMIDVPVSFVVASGGGSVADTRVSTDGSGLATCGGWFLGATPGQSTLVASVDGIKSVLFTATGRLLPSGIESYDLQTIGGKALPLTYSGGGTTWDVVGGPYVLADDGSFTHVYLVRTVPDGVPKIDSNAFRGTYGPLDSTITFYDTRKLFFASGIIRGDVLAVTYDDWIDFEDEVYVRPPS